MIDNWIQWLLNFARAKGGDLRFKTENLNDFSIEYPNLIGCIRSCEEQKRWTELYELVYHTWGYVYVIGDLQALEEICIAANKAATELQDERKLAWVKLWVARSARWHRKFDRVISLSIEAEAVAEKYRDDALLGELWEQHTYVLFAQGKLEEAEKLAKATIEKGEQQNIHHVSGYAAEHLSEIAAQKGNFAEAHEWLTKARNYVKDRGLQRVTADINYRQAKIFIMQGRYPEAETLLIDAMNSYSTWKEHRRIADCRYRLAELYYAEGEFTQSRQMAEEAQGTYRRIGMDKWVEDISRLISQLPA